MGQGTPVEILVCKLGSLLVLFPCLFSPSLPLPLFFLSPSLISLYLHLLSVLVSQERLRFCQIRDASATRDRGKIETGSKLDQNKGKARSRGLCSLCWIVARIVRSERDLCKISDIVAAPLRREPDLATNLASILRPSRAKKCYYFLVRKKV